MNYIERLISSRPEISCAKKIVDRSWPLVLVALTVSFMVGVSPAEGKEIRGSEVLVAMNNERIVNGIKPLTVNVLLVKAAQLKADDLAKNHYFLHHYHGQSLKDFLEKARYSYKSAGENLAQGFNSVEALDLAWMNSPTHKANVLDLDYKETGIGIAHDGKKTIVVQYFGTR